MMTQLASDQPCATPTPPALLRIDDNPDDLLLFQLAWEKSLANNPIHCATSCKEAIEYLEGRGRFADRATFPLPALIVIDMCLPDGNACDFLRWIRSHAKLNKMVVIVHSGTAHQEQVNEAYRCGANSFLLKPANSRHLDAIVKLIQSYWLGQNVPVGRLTPFVLSTPARCNAAPG